ncbi:MAG: hypothetical protein ACREO3_09560, partial [Arenimonas sp.]
MNAMRRRTAPNRWLRVFAVALCLVTAACGNSADPAATPAAAAPVAAPPEDLTTTPTPAPTPAEPGSLEAGVKAAVDQLANELGDAETQTFLAAIPEAGESPHAALGALSFVGDHLERMTWLYGLGVLAEPDNAVYLNNFAVGLHEKAILTSTVTPDRALLDVAVMALQKAVALQPGEAAYQQDLGYALLESWRTRTDAATLQTAADALRKAVALDPESVAAWSHLAEVLSAQQDVAGAVDAITRARALAPFHGALLATYPRLVPAVDAELKKLATGCAQIDYECKAQCPRSIIGQVNFVTCEVAQSSAQGACEAGRPYATDFDCREQLPEFGILIPGLNSGFSLITPIGRIDLVVDGQGWVDWKFSTASEKIGAVGVSISGKGSWSPSSGFTEMEFKEGFSYSKIGGDAAKVMGEYKMGPASVNASVDFQDSANVRFSAKAYGG